MNEQLTPQQQWQDFCHELAHVLLHTGDQGRMSPLFHEYQENKANNFMHHACVPSFMLDEIEPSNLTVEYVQQKFNEEYDFALKRLEQYHNKRLLF
ncbi:ImmA/IrrE family metallo-endopeptidase [Lysinibacillus xylanilyticus]|uniref:ImmA/IrrE family metallo-endopeptidase n=1 Tax=Lysinibacillus xylanilyticus TaxID=582475 RepID=UPI003D0406D7